MYHDIPQWALNPKSYTVIICTMGSIQYQGDVFLGGGGVEGGVGTTNQNVNMSSWLGLSFQETHSLGFRV